MTQLNKSVGRQGRLSWGVPLLFGIMALGGGCSSSPPQEDTLPVPEDDGAMLEESIEGSEAWGVQAVSFHSGPCYGTCPVFEYRINQDGAALFDGEKFTAVEGEQAAPGGRDMFLRIISTLAPVRPQNGDRVIDRDLCQPFATDMITYTVVWETVEGEQRLSYYNGCADERFMDVKRTLAEVRAMLPVGALIGTDR